MTNQITPYRLLFLSLLILVFKDSFSQAPKISYATPQTYVAGTVISPLLPSHSGGEVPANIYQQVTTFAGSGTASSYNGIGLNSGFNMPSGIGTDLQSNVYVCDYGSGTVRKITPSAQVSTIGYVGTPTGLTADADGNTYISSFDNQSIHKINTAGVNSIFVGTAGGFNSPGGLNFDLSGNLYLADQKNNKIRKITSNGTVSTVAGTGAAGNLDGNALISTFNNPDGVAVDRSGNVFVADAGNNKIRKISPAGIVSTFAGDGVAGNTDGIGINARLYYPTGITIDPLDNLYVADYRNNKIRKITPDGEVTTLAGNGTQGNLNGIGTNSSFNGPIMLAFDVSGNLYVTDFLNNLIRKISLTGYTIDKTLPAGLTFDPRTGIITGTPTAASPARAYTITAYNLLGSSSAMVTIQTTLPSDIVFPELPAKTICDLDFEPGATSGLPITYTSSSTQVAEIINGLIHITGAGTSTITATNGIETASQTLIVSGFQRPFAVINADATRACEGMKITFKATTDNTGDNPTYVWMINGEEIVNDDPVFSSTSFNDGDLVTLKIINNDYCVPVISNTSNIIRLTILPDAVTAVKIETSSPEAICAGKPITFTAKPENVQGNATYRWFVNSQELNTMGYGSITLTNLNDGDEVSCMMQSTNLCVSNRIAYSNVIKALIRNDCEINAPNSFSPNGDGINDYWKVLSVGVKDIVRVFNRNGSIVYGATGYEKPWDGTFNGKALPVGVYYYLIISGNKKISGSVSIIR
ncbi:NHL domain-containing protein [Pedobacter chinensis]|uniref:NHL domain-containing protein n=1 Tax=Pedobacter chinensis TaxID=2282421 RepID=UPI001314FB90|nr:gliding motility-associated C-terminal domain-containing protein [Pedobacter chinensis]